MHFLKNSLLGSTATLALALGIIGCEPGRPDVVPSSAQLRVSGNQMMHYQAPSDGTVYIYDNTAQRLISTVRVSRGDAIDIDTQKGQITSGGMVVTNKMAAPLDQKDIYFEPSPASMQSNNPSNGVVVTPNVSVQPNNGTTTNNGVTVQPGVSVSPAQP